MADLHISSEAEADLDDIWLYVAKESQSIEPAELFLDRFARFLFPPCQEPLSRPAAR